MDEKFPEPFLRDVRFDHRRVKAIARFRDRLFVDVGREDLDFGRLIQLARMFAQENRDRVRFFASCAARDPNPQLVIAFFAGEQLRDVTLQGRERFPVSEKMSDANEQVLEQSARFSRMRAHEIHVLRDALERVHLEPPRDPAQNRRALVMFEVVAGLGPKV